MMDPAYEKVLVAIDGSETSKRVLEHVRVLAPIHDSEVVVYHVRQKAYAGAATLDVEPSSVVSPQEAAEELTRAGIRADLWKKTRTGVTPLAPSSTQLIGRARR
jgi:nucleotide-binding universal stress UspA family protein